MISMRDHQLDVRTAATTEQSVGTTIDELDS
jgi:hypothetical protein